MRISYLVQCKSKFGLLSKYHKTKLKVKIYCKEWENGEHNLKNQDIDYFSIWLLQLVRVIIKSIDEGSNY